MSEHETLGSLGYTEDLNLWGGGSRKYFGKYRGTVVNNVDPKRQGRLLVEATDALSFFPSNWAMPCVPIGGLQFGAYLIPPIGAGVWVEFEQGDSSRPIWTGFYAGSAADPPATAQMTTPGAPAVVFGTTAQASVVLCDVPIPPMRGPGVMLRSGASTLIVDTAGVLIISADVQIVSAKTDINIGALVVT